MSRRKMDPEIKALKSMRRALMRVDLAARKRMLEWAWSVYLADAAKEAAQPKQEGPRT